MYIELRLQFGDQGVRWWGQFSGQGTAPVVEYILIVYTEFLVHFEGQEDVLGITIERAETCGFRGIQSHFH